MFMQDAHKQRSKGGAHPLCIHINMNSEKNASAVTNIVNAPNDIPPSALKKFTLEQEAKMLKLNLKDVSDTKFISSFLISLSGQIKALSKMSNDESKISFHFDGEEESAAGMCLASAGLWESEFCFSKEAEEAKFLDMSNGCFDFLASKSDEIKASIIKQAGV